MRNKKKKLRDITEHKVYNNRFTILKIIKILMIFIAALLFTFFTIIVAVNLFSPTVGVSMVYPVASILSGFCG